MRPALSALAATRRWDTRNTWLATRQPPTPPGQLPARGHRRRLEPRPRPDVSGPISAILLLLTGRTAALEHLTGDGADALRLPQNRGT